MSSWTINEITFGFYYRISGGLRQEMEAKRGHRERIGESSLKNRPHKDSIKGAGSSGQYKLLLVGTGVQRRESRHEAAKVADGSNQTSIEGKPRAAQR